MDPQEKEGKKEKEEEEKKEEEKGEWEIVADDGKLPIFDDPQLGLLFFFVVVIVVLV